MEDKPSIVTKLNNVCVRTSNISVRLGCLLLQLFRSDGTGGKKKKNREALKVLYSVTKFSFRAHILIPAFLSSPPGKPRKTNFFLLK